MEEYKRQGERIDGASLLGNRSAPLYKKASDGTVNSFCRQRQASAANPFDSTFATTMATTPLTPSPSAGKNAIAIQPVTKRLGNESRQFGINNKTPTVVQAHAKFALAFCDDDFLNAGYLLVSPPLDVPYSYGSASIRASIPGMHNAGGIGWIFPPRILLLIRVGRFIEI